MRRTLLTTSSALALSALAFAGAAQAAPPRLDVRPAVGAMLSSGWQRVVLHVENPADGMAIDGEATLHLRDGRNQIGVAAPSDWVQPVRLAPGESKDIPFDVRSHSSTFPIVDASVVQGNGRSSVTLASETFDALKSQPDGQVKILHITEEVAQTDPLGGLNGQRVGVRGSVLERQYAEEVGRVVDAPAKANRMDYQRSSPARVFTISPADAPDMTLPLSPFSAVYVDDMAKLTPAQQEAIRRYVAEGGVLATFGAKETQRQEGSGVVATLADPLSAWAWARTLRSGLQKDRVRIALAPRFSLFEDSGYVDPGSVNGPGWGAAGLTPQPPPFSTVALFLGVYLIVLVPVQYAVLKRLGKREWAWGVTPALALVFAGAAYGLGQAGRSKIQAHQVGSILELGNGVGRGAVLTNIGIYSPGLTNAEVSVEAPEVHVWKASGSLNAPAEYRPDSRHASLRGLRLAQWSVASVSARSEATLGEGIRITPSAFGSIVNGRRFPEFYTIENRTGNWLRAVQCYGSFFDLAPGATHRVEVNSSQATRNYGGSMSHRMHQAVWESGDSTYLTATLDEPLVNVRINGSDAPPQKSATMVVVRF